MAAVNPIARVIESDCREALKCLPDESVHCVVTSPPYWALRDYGFDGQIGLEKTPDEYVALLVEVFRAVWRVLRDDGTLWLNLGDSYNNFRSQMGPGQAFHGRDKLNGKPAEKSRRRGVVGLKEKDLVGIPWRVAFALQADGWYLRQDIIWHKPNPMPESVTDRCTKAHEYVFLLSKKPRYYFDAEAVKEPVTETAHARGNGVNPKAASIAAGNHRGRPKQNESFSHAVRGLVSSRNIRSVWSIHTTPYRGAHFATFPEALVRRCVLAGCPPGGVVLDPFAGSGTVGVVAHREGCSSVLIEASAEYVALMRERLKQTMQGNLW